MLTQDLTTGFRHNLLFSHARLRNRRLIVVERVRHNVAHLLHLIHLLRVVMFEALLTNNMGVKCIIEQL